VVAGLSSERKGKTFNSDPFVSRQAAVQPHATARASYEGLQEQRPRVPNHIVLDLGKCGPKSLDNCLCASQRPGLRDGPDIAKRGQVIEHAVHRLLASAKSLFSLIVRMIMLCNTNWSSHWLSRPGHIPKRENGNGSTSPPWAYRDQTALS
jgi:hypothetical protein